MCSETRCGSGLSVSFWAGVRYVSFAAMDTAAALRIISGPEPFAIEWVGVDERRRAKGGRHMKKAKALRCGASHNLARHDQVSIKDADGEGHPIAVHIDLITRVNGEVVE